MLENVPRPGRWHPKVALPPHGSLASKSCFSSSWKPGFHEEEKQLWTYNRIIPGHTKNICQTRAYKVICALITLHCQDA